MAKNPGNQSKSLFTTKECSKCGLKPALFLCYVWHKGRYLHICTACVLNLHREAFCPFCFKVYDNPNNLSEDCVKCCGCNAVCHFTCIPATNSSIPSMAATSAASSSTFSFSTSPQAFICPFCYDPNLKFFKFSRDERSRVKIDSYLASQMLAAANISKRSIDKAVTMTRVRAQILCKESVQAEKEAKEALQKLHDLTLPPQAEDRESESEFVSDDPSDDDDNHDDDDGGGDDVLEDETENAPLQDEHQNESKDTSEYGPQDDSSDFEYVYNSEEPSESDTGNDL